MYLIAAYRDGVVFEEPRKREPVKNRLTIVSIYRLDTAQVCLGGKWLDAWELKTCLQGLTDLSELKEIRLISDNSAGPVNVADSMPDAWAHPLAERLSVVLPGIAVKGYIGMVRTRGTESVLQAIASQKPANVVKRMLAEDFAVVKTNYSYRSATYLNGVNIQYTAPLTERRTVHWGAVAVRSIPLVGAGHKLPPR
ncbi:hypothetical protein KNO81_37585 [Paraburkholderia sediminicola]|nr:hypothetical protein [Paraburkholderia sediminicola]